MVCAASILINQDNFGMLTFAFFTYPYLNEITPIALIVISILSLFILGINKKIVIDLIEVIIVLLSGIVLLAIKKVNTSLLLYAYICVFVVYTIYLIVKLNSGKVQKSN